MVDSEQQSESKDCRCRACSGGKACSGKAWSDRAHRVRCTIGSEVKTGLVTGAGVC